MEEYAADPDGASGGGGICFRRDFGRDLAPDLANDYLPRMPRPSAIRPSVMALPRDGHGFAAGFAQSGAAIDPKRVLRADVMEVPSPRPAGSPRWRSASPCPSDAGVGPLCGAAFLRRQPRLSLARHFDRPGWRACARRVGGAQSAAPEAARAAGRREHRGGAAPAARAVSIWPHSRSAPSRMRGGWRWISSGGMKNRLSRRAASRLASAPLVQPPRRVLAHARGDDHLRVGREHRPTPIVGVRWATSPNTLGRHRRTGGSRRRSGGGRSTVISGRSQIWWNTRTVGPGYRGGELSRRGGSSPAGFAVRFAWWRRDRLLRLRPCLRGCAARSDRFNAERLQRREVAFAVAAVPADHQVGRAPRPPRGRSGV